MAQGVRTRRTQCGRRSGSGPVPLQTRAVGMARDACGRQLREQHRSEALRVTLATVSGTPSGSPTSARHPPVSTHIRDRPRTFPAYGLLTRTPEALSLRRAKGPLTCTNVGLSLIHI